MTNPIKPRVLSFANRDEWLELRKPYIGASEVACLFGVGFTTFYQFWHTKAGNIDDEFLDDQITIICGEELESGVANIVRRVKDYDLRKSHRFLVYGDPEYQLACSLDYELRTGDAGWVPAEIKVIDWMSLKDNWEETENAGEYDPPMKYILQLQHQLLVTGKPYGYLFALVGNKQLIEVKMDAEPVIQAEILKRVKDFWGSIALNIPPAPDLDNDLAVMLKTMTNVEDGRELHVHGDDRVEDMFVQYALAAEREKNAAAIKSRLRAEMLEFMGPAIRLKASNGTIGCKLTDRWGKERRDLRITPAKHIKNAL